MDRLKPLDLGAFDKHPNERLFVDVDFGANLESIWQPGKLYRLGDFVRPGNGFAYQAQSDFTSGSREPRWTVDTAVNTLDGSGQWIPFRANYQGVDVIDQAGATLPTGLTVDGDVSWEGARVTVPVSGGTDGVTYECIVTAETIGGQVIVGMFACVVSTKRRRCA